MIRLLLFLSLLAPPLLAAGPAATTHLEWRRAAAQAHERADYPAYLAATEAALALRPDSSRYLLNLAGAYALNHRPADALAACSCPLSRRPIWRRSRLTPRFRPSCAAWPLTASRAVRPGSRSSCPR